VAGGLPDLILVCVSLSPISGLDDIVEIWGLDDCGQALLISLHGFDSEDDRMQAVRKAI
jgi:hypothetical protein